MDVLAIARCSHCHRQVKINFEEKNCELVLDGIMFGEFGPEAWYRTEKHFINGEMCPGSDAWPDPDSLEV